MGLINPKTISHKDIILTSLSVISFISLIIFEQNFLNITELISKVDYILSGQAFNPLIYNLLLLSFFTSLYLTSSTYISNKKLITITSIVLLLLSIYLTLVSRSIDLLYGFFLASMSIITIPYFYLYRKKYFFIPLVSILMFWVVFSLNDNILKNYTEKFIIAPLNSSMYIVSKLYESQLESLTESYIKSFEYGYDYATYLAVNYTQDLELYVYLNSQKQEAINVIRQEAGNEYDFIKDYLYSTLENQIISALESKEGISFILVALIYYAILGLILFFSNIFEFFLFLLMSRLEKHSTKPSGEFK